MASDSKAANFVTALGWILVAFMGFGVVMALMQNVMINFMLPLINEQARTQPGQMPAAVVILFRVVAAFVLCVSAFLLWAAWAFLKRRNWARQTWVVIFALNAASSAFTVLVFVGMGFFTRMPVPQSGGIPPGFTTAFRAMGIVMGIVSIGFIVLFVWLIKRLRSPDVRAEFQSPSAS
ncbi:MAG TPA: hypothetical protein VGQ22_12235 [Steroidobacteraceae bacterium]|jgi:hypothetical protein|nr:hypothetical protein [Steroidobacteraceae bacterium]